MQTTIYYFSSTGNSLEVAKNIAAGLEEAELVSIPKALKDGLNLSANKIGIVFPVYMWGLPLIVVEFLKKLQNLDKKYVFAVATYGGFPAGTLVQLQKQLKKQNVTLAAGFGVRMPGNYTPMYGALPIAKQNKIFAQAQDKIKKIITAIKIGQHGILEKNFFLLNWLFSGLFYRGGSKQIPLAAKKFWLTDACNGCGTCVKVCPAQNIKLENGKPTWLDHCQHCLACLQWCPTEAIQYGKNTQKRKRYHHPDIKLTDIILRV